MTEPLSANTSFQQLSTEITDENRQSPASGPAQGHSLPCVSTARRSQQPASGKRKLRLGLWLLHAEQHVEQADPGDPGSGLRVTILTTDTVRPGPFGAQATRTVQVRDANGSLGVVSVDITKSDNIHAIQIQIAPSKAIK
jgi:hypothetical protein